MPGCRRGIPTGRTAWRPGRESRILTCAGQGTPLLPALQGTAGRRRRCRRKLMDQIYLPATETAIRQHRIPLPRFFPDRNQPDQSHTHRKPGQRIPGGAARHRAMPFSGIPGRRNPDRRISVRGAQGGAMLLTRISSRKNPDKQISARRAQGDAMPLTRISGRKNPDKQISARRAQGGAMPLTGIPGRKNPSRLIPARKIPDRQLYRTCRRIGAAHGISQA